MAGKYTVFAVDSADRLTLLLPPSGGAPEFRQVLLSYIQAPKPARRQGADVVPDEPCGYDAMEHTRALVIGKEVTFADDYSVDALQRVAGRMTLKDGTDVAASLLKAGLAAVNDRVPGKVDKAVFERYSELQNQAKSAKIGVWSPKAREQIRDLKPFPPPNAEELAKKLQGNEVKVRVERVQSGHMLFVTLLDGSWQQLQLNMTGIQCPPSIRKDGSGADPIGAEAKFFTERMLLNRHLMIRFEGIDNFGNFHGSVVSPKGTFQEQLLAKGLAKVQHATLVNCITKDALRAAEAKATADRVGVWKDFVERAAVTVTSTGEGGGASSGAAAAAAGGADEVNRDYSGVRDFDAVVTQVINGDTIVVRNLESNETVKVSLCGIRGCKSIRREQDPGKSQEVRVSYEEYSWEAKEFLRTKFLGMRVKVHVEYGRRFEDSQDVRAVATVVDEVSGVNVGAALLAQGFGKFFLGKSDVCSCADELQQAEAQARERGVGVHSTKDAPVTKVVELTRLGETKAKHYLTFLQRGMQGGRPPVWKGVVDVVLGGSSVRVYVPREHFQFTLKLAGIISPSGGFGSEPADPFAQEAKDFAIQHVQQRDVEVTVDGSDKGGNFIGSLTIKGKNFAVMLVEAGLASVSNADRLPYHSALVAAEKVAKDAKKFIWSSPSALPQRQQKREAELLKLRPDSFAPCTGSESNWSTLTIADVIDGNTVTVQIENAESAAARTAIQAAVNRAVQGAQAEPKKGDVVVALFKEDKQWYRAKVTNVFPEDSHAEVVFTDFGTRIEVKLKDIRPVPRTPEFAVLRDTPALAHVVKVAYLRPLPVGNEYCDAACDEIWAFVEENAALGGRCDYVDGHGNKYYTIAAGPKSASLTERLLKAGLGVGNKSALALNKEAETRCNAAQLVAKKAHANMWRYGDVGVGEDEDDY